MTAILKQFFGTLNKCVDVLYRICKLKITFTAAGGSDGAAVSFRSSFPLLIMNQTDVFTAVLVSISE